MVDPKTPTCTAPIGRLVNWCQTLSLIMEQSTTSIEIIIVIIVVKLNLTGVCVIYFPIIDSIKYVGLSLRQSCLWQVCLCASPVCGRFVSAPILSVAGLSLHQSCLWQVCCLIYIMKISQLGPFFGRRLATMAIWRHLLPDK